MERPEGRLSGRRIVILNHQPEPVLKTPDPDDLSNLSMLELFQVEADSQIAVLIGGLLQLEREPDARPQLEVLMRAAHSFKGAARIVNQDAAVVVAHAMEDCFVAAQLGRIKLRQDEIDVLFQGVDLLHVLGMKPMDAMNFVHGKSHEAALPFRDHETFAGFEGFEAEVNAQKFSQ